MSVRNPTNELLALERGFWKAAGDASFYNEHFHDDGLMLLPHLPHPLDKAAVLASVAGASAWTDVVMDDIAVAEPSPFVAILAYRAQARRNDDAPYRALVSSTYLAEGTTWRMLGHQQTPLP